MDICAIVPIKAYRCSKTRLRSVLSQSQCATVARLMATDMLETLASVPEISRIVILGQGDDQVRLARLHHCDYAADDPGSDISGNLTRVARQPEQARSDVLLYIPADLAFVKAADIQRLLGAGRRGTTICRAIRDGGTNALLATPPGNLRFAFGADSARRHAGFAADEDREVHMLDDVAFQRDIDVPEDLVRLCRRGGDSLLIDYLFSSGLSDRLEALLPVTLAS